MSVDLDRQLREYCRQMDDHQGALSVDDIIDRADGVQVLPRPKIQQPSPRRKWVMAAAAAAVILIVSFGIRFLPATDSSPQPVDQPTTTTTWPGPVRDNSTSLGIITMEQDTSGDGTWSWEDPLDTSVGWADVTRVAFLAEGQPHWYIELAAKPPLAADLEPGELIAYGLVLDTNADGIADYLIGIDNNAPQAGDFRVWVTDVATGETEEQIGPPYGRPIEFMHFDEVQPGDYPPGHPPTMFFTFLSGSAPADFNAETLSFYAWSSTTADGEVLAWDYAPDASWLRIAAPEQTVGPDGTSLPPPPEMDPEARVFSIPVNNTSGEPAEMFVASNTQPTLLLVGTVEPTTVAPGQTEDVTFTVPEGDGWGIFVNSTFDGGPLIIAQDIPPDASGELPIEIHIDQFGSAGIQISGDLEPGWFGN